MEESGPAPQEELEGSPSQVGQGSGRVASPNKELESKSGVWEEAQPFLSGMTWEARARNSSDSVNPLQLLHNVLSQLDEPHTHPCAGLGLPCPPRLAQGGLWAWAWLSSGLGQQGRWEHPQLRAHTCTEVDVDFD